MLPPAAQNTYFGSPAKQIPYALRNLAHWDKIVEIFR